MGGSLRKSWVKNCAGVQSPPILGALLQVLVLAAAVLMAKSQQVPAASLWRVSDHQVPQLASTVKVGIFAHLHLSCCHIISNISILCYLIPCNSTYFCVFLCILLYKTGVSLMLKCSGDLSVQLHFTYHLYFHRPSAPRAVLLPAQDQTRQSLDSGGTEGSHEWFDR